MDWVRDVKNGKPLVLYGGDRDPVAYFEAHPRVSGGELADNFATERARCVWFWPDDGAPYAQAFFERADGESVWVDMRAPRVSAGPRRQQVRVASATNYSDQRAFSVFSCPNCSRRCKNLVFTYKWACRTCSGLIYRSQRIGSKVAKWERRDTLSALIGAGRPKGMHHKTFDGLRCELEGLAEELGSVRAEAPIEYRHSLQRKWIKSTADPQDETKTDES